MDEKLTKELEGINERIEMLVKERKLIEDSLERLKTFTKVKKEKFDEFCRRNESRKI